MKKLSFKKKSVNEEIITNEPRLVKDRSIKHIFKMNFLPITFLVYSVVIVLVVFLFMAGSSEENQNVSGEHPGESNIWTARGLMDDMELGGSTTSIKIDFSSLIDGDSIVIKDRISNTPTYDSVTDSTTITFSWTGGSFNPVFEGDITSLYQNGDQVKIYVTIKRVTFTLGPPDVLQEMNYDMEIFEKQWENEEYYVANMATPLQGLKALPQSSIEKI